MPVLTEWSIQIAVEEVFANQKADPERVRERRPGLYARTVEAVAEANQCIDPVVAYKQLQVLSAGKDRLILENGLELPSRFIARQLAAAQSLVIAISTVGPRIETLATENLQQGKAAQGYAYDSSGVVALNHLVRQFYERLEQSCNGDGKFLSHRFSPGLDEWPVTEGQPVLFKLLEDINQRVELTPSCQMLPLKSVSFVIGIGQGIIRTGSDCDFCSMRDRCQFREAGRSHDSRTCRD